ncbi:DUF3826 domain-containing protein [Sphingobacterium arenae]|uniref:DUF3826 domain-containing protein n=1 Tax=Sphingobacterium arenae TaxID=1280598 RepID=A0ABR7XZX9_9SPHI|nr:DUF3826 domain-containing protein [Sphingobacterium arenae]MBD1424588.1 DUF3826 domain-containing protein [Sphingobacterium arenae]
MKVNMKWFAGILLMFFVGKGFAQTEEEKYLQVITERSDKIVTTLGITDSVKYNQVRDVLVNQYATLNAHHENREAEIKKLKGTFAGQKEALEEERTKYEAKEDAALREIHHTFLEALGNLIQSEQIEKIKDGMTYGVLPLTYGAYQDMIPSLTSEQKARILVYLTEARELAMDAPGSKEKHGVFGKYKGRINNYLSSEGYNLKEEGDRWAERRAK